jgi:hypothetical protein
MAAAQRQLEMAEGADLLRAQGQMKQLRILNALPGEIDYMLFQYEQEAKREEEIRNA